MRMHWSYVVHKDCLTAATSCANFKNLYIILLLVSLQIQSELIILELRSNEEEHISLMNENPSHIK